MTSAIRTTAADFKLDILHLAALAEIEGDHYDYEAVLHRAVQALANEVADVHGDNAQLVFNDLLNDIDPQWRVKTN